MAKVTKTVLKGYFETGDVPNQNQYGELIDSQLNLAETGTQISEGTISASSFISEDNLIVKGHISASEHISASAISASSDINIGGKITGLTGSLGHIMGNLADGTGSLYFNSNSTFRTTITASSNISASGHISCSGLIVAGSEVTIKGGVITAEGFVGPLTASGITSTGPGTFTTIDTGQGATEVYAMNQDVETTDAVTFATVNTGQGANELYDMDQNVLTTSTPTFSTLTVGEAKVTGTAAQNEYTWDDNATINSRAFHLATTVPSVDTAASTTTQIIINNEVGANSVVIGVASVGLSIVCHTISAGAFKFFAKNDSPDTQITEQSAILNFIVL